jgi:hypothetical protein
VCRAGRISPNIKAKAAGRTGGRIEGQPGGHRRVTQEAPLKVWAEVRPVQIEIDGRRLSGAEKAPLPANQIIRARVEATVRNIRALAGVSARFPEKRTIRNRLKNATLPPQGRENFLVLTGARLQQGRRRRVREERLPAGSRPPRHLKDRREVLLKPRVLPRPSRNSPRNPLSPRRPRKV